MKNIFRLTLLALLCFSNSLSACELSAEYIETRKEVIKHARDAYLDCTGSVSKTQYWYRFVQCFKAGDGEGIGGGCGHVSGMPSRNYKSLKIDNEFCDVLKPTTKEMKESLATYVEDKNIKKCK